MPFQTNRPPSLPFLDRFLFSSSLPILEGPPAIWGRWPPNWERWNGTSVVPNFGVQIGLRYRPPRKPNPQISPDSDSFFHFLRIVKESKMCRTSPLVLFSSLLLLLPVFVDADGQYQQQPAGGSGDGYAVAPPSYSTPKKANYVQGGRKSESEGGEGYTKANHEASYAGNGGGQGGGGGEQAVGGGGRGDGSGSGGASGGYGGRQQNYGSGSGGGQRRQQQQYAPIPPAQAQPQQSYVPQNPAPNSYSSNRQGGGGGGYQSSASLFL